MTDSAETTPQRLQRIQTKRAEQGRRTTRRHREEAAAVERIRVGKIRAGLKAKEQAGQELSTPEQVTAALADLHATLDEREQNGESGNPSIEEEKETLTKIGKPIGKQLAEAIMRAGRKTGQTTVDALPITMPLSFAGAGFAHELTERYPEVMTAFVEYDEAALVALTLGFLSVRGIIKEKKPIEPIIREFHNQMELFRQNPARKSIQTVLFGAACLGAILTAADPEGAGRTFASLLGSVAALQFVHSFTEKFTGDVLLEIARREETGGVVDITDPTFLLSMGLTEIKKIARNFVGGIRHGKTTVRRLRKLGRQQSERDTAPHGFTVDLATALLLGDENGNGESNSNPRGGNTSRHVGQDPDEDTN